MFFRYVVAALLIAPTDEVEPATDAPAHGSRVRTSIHEEAILRRLGAR